MAKHLIMDHTGHSTVEFDPSKTVDLREAMERFERLTKSGHAAAVKNPGDAGYKLTRTFDPTAEETLFVPQMQGG